MNECKKWLLHIKILNIDLAWYLQTDDSRNLTEREPQICVHPLTPPIIHSSIIAPNLFLDSTHFRTRPKFYKVGGNDDDHGAFAWSS